MDANPTVSSASAASRLTSRSVTRRAALLSSGMAILVGGVAGAAYGALATLTDGQPATPAPLDLVAALESESALIAAIDGSVAGDPSLRKVLAEVRADHVAHQAVLRAAVAAYPGQPSSPVPKARRTPTARAFGRPELRALELHASAAAARYARGLFGRDAVVLASIAACEASHAELLT